MAEMTREEAAREIENTACCFSDKRFRDAMHMAANSLRGPQPDPITGLVPCGCGGRAVLDGAYGDDEVESSYRTEIYCEQCLIRTPIYTEDEQVKAAWNRAMGYKGDA